MSDFATYLFGVTVVVTTALNVAFQLMPVQMTHLLQSLIA